MKAFFFIIAFFFSFNCYILNAQTDVNLKDIDREKNVNNLNLEIKKIEKELFNDNTIIEKILELRNDKEMIGILKDSEMINAVNNGDISKLLSNEKFLKIMYNKKIQEIQKSYNKK